MDKKEKRKKMVRVVVDGCKRTRAGGTMSEWFTLLSTIATALLLSMSSELGKEHRHTIMGWLLGVLVAAMVIGMPDRSCKDKVDEANRLTSPDIERPTCVKTYSGFTSFQLAYVALAAVASLILRNRSFGRIIAVAFGGIALLAWVLGLVFAQRCAAKLN